MNEADCAAKETDVRYTHEEVFSRVRIVSGVSLSFWADPGVYTKECGIMDQKIKNAEQWYDNNKALYEKFSTEIEEIITKILNR